MVVTQISITKKKLVKINGNYWKASVNSRNISKNQQTASEMSLQINGNVREISGN